MSSCCDDYPECYHRVEQDRKARRKTDTRPALPAQPMAYREALALGLHNIIIGNVSDPESVLKNAADKLRRDEQNNAEMVDVLVRAGYNDIPAQIDASVIRRLLDYVSPR